MTSPRLPLGLHNLRSLGGTPVAGGHIRERALLRSSAAFRHDDSLGDFLRAQGITGVIDLRDDAERAGTTDWADYGVSVASVPIFNNQLAHLEWSELADLYMQMARNFGGQLAQAVTAAAELSAEGGVLIHCTAGKDRTGVVTGLILSILGASRETILADYLTSATALGESYQEDLAFVMGREYIPGAAAHRAVYVTEEALSAATVRIEAAGGAREYLLGHGIDPAVFELLRAHLVEPDTSR
ncbi:MULTISPECIES: tyrosine-protein phosphatase [Actinotignum]|uniref:Tyrosine-protein phosphatase n=2 Tax=Actinotignum TaxID=1653174 RepID=A0AAW9HG86_9ACTO|nr:MULTISPECIES: tyrosine-protein phosphatase [Actinotignum]MBS5748968.1 tyrosine-protein phosphatase [Actinotignum schaalii]MDE1558481.1 tyrosine-protein phosphatase [Actinotignum schaalii]MDE1662738.1 tyrosine-protein phosphatase [Actinotignum schaalii]MDK6372616.1 tyrosine-protein phosphatase [Actinotignum timonense]MDK6418380.1 tyrosine-protein phosphatase [Actinotignum timonense]